MGSVNTRQFLNAITYRIRTVAFLMKIQVLWDDGVTEQAVWDVLNDSSAFNTVSHIR